MKLKILFPALCALMICLVGCKKDEPQEPKEPATQEENNQKEDKDTKGPKLNVYEIEADAAGGVYKVQLTSTSMWSALPDKNWVTVDPEMGNGNAIVNVRVQAGTETDTAKINFVNDEGERTLLVYREKSEIQEPSVSSTYVPAPISISATKKVFFSPGNLQYRASTNTWRFAPQQYECQGYDNNNEGAYKKSYSGWIDLFGWGTGNNPINTSEESSDYSHFVDWGTNKIGSDAAGTWYTLSNDEWNYIFFERENAAKLFGFGKVEENRGLIILPDDWTTPSGSSFSSSTSHGFVDILPDESDWRLYWKDWTSEGDSYNIYTIAQWQQMEAAGAVFLPCGIWRIGNTMFAYNEGTGVYWSNNSYNSDEAYKFTLSFSWCVEPQGKNKRSIGQSVRLVKNVK